MLWRVGDLKEKYWRWIHQPYDGTLRLFESSVLENLTRTPWWLVPLVWMPVVIIYFFIGINIMYELFGKLLILFKYYFY